MRSVVHVAIPVLKGRTNVVVDKGQPWSVVEHLLLEALARQEWSANELSSAANIPHRVVIEGIIRLMRAGWVDLSEIKGRVTFRANAFGIVAAAKTELPKTFERIRRQINYTVDLVDGGVFRGREWYVYDEYALRERARKEPVVWIQPESFADVWDREEFYETLLEYDETLVSADPSGHSRKYVLVSVSNGSITGLPDRTLGNLRAAIIEAANSISPKALGDDHIFSTPGIGGPIKSKNLQERSIYFDSSDLVLDSDAHRKILKHILENANTHVYVHSTFIEEDKVLDWLPEIVAASKRGVKIHVLWGQNEDVPFIVSTRTSISNLTKNKEIQNLGDSFVIHPFSTGSHAKLILADSGKGGAYIAVVGSCNWFSSGFKSYEASVVLRDAQIVRDVARYFSDLSVGHNGIWSNLSTELVKISKSLRDVPVSPKANARASIVIGAHHESFVLRARDEAKKRIFAASHRLGPVSVASILIPIMTGAKAHAINANVFYGRTTGSVFGAREDVIVAEAALAGVSVNLIETPRLHAKVLAWDDDAVVITSLNWLSAASGDLQSLKEIGVFIEAKAVAEVIISNFKSAKDGTKHN